MSLLAQNLFSVAGKTVVLTGASGYLGRTFSLALLENGARLIALGRSERLLTEAAAWQKQFGADRAEAHRVDMYDLEKLGQLFESIAARGHPIDVLVNNAHELGENTGFNTAAGLLESASLDQWNRHFLGGIYWPALAVQKLAPGLKASASASIINISTMYALVAPSPKLYQGTDFSNPPGYSTSKAGLLAFTRYIASYWGSNGIRANAILPGPFSNIADKSENSVSGEDPFLDRLRERTCLGRIGRPSELAGALLFLASNASSYMTGQALVIDGGWTVT